MTSSFHLKLITVAVAVLALTALTHIAEDRLEDRGGVLEATASVEEGDMLTQRGEFEEAREAYKEAEQRVRARGELPHLELRRIANAFYYEGRYRAAAGVLRGLADDAKAHGDADSRALALADAIWLTELSGDEQAASQLRAELREVSESPELSEHVRQQIGPNPTGDLRVFAPHLTP